MKSPVSAWNKKKRKLFDVWTKNENFQIAWTKNENFQIVWTKNENFQVAWTKKSFWKFEFAKHSKSIKLVVVWRRFFRRNLCKHLHQIGGKVLLLLEKIFLKFTLVLKELWKAFRYIKCRRWVHNLLDIHFANCSTVHK